MRDEEKGKIHSLPALRAIVSFSWFRFSLCRLLPSPERKDRPMNCPDCLVERIKIVELKPHPLLMFMWFCLDCGYSWSDPNKPENYRCPLCREFPELIMNPEQATCTNDDCRVFMFNPSLPDGGLSHATTIEEWTDPTDGTTYLASADQIARLKKPISPAE
jgi:hypothetical protein